MFYVLDYAAGGDLFHFMCKMQDNRLNEESVRFFGAQLASATGKRLDAARRKQAARTVASTLLRLHQLLLSRFWMRWRQQEFDCKSEQVAVAICKAQAAAEDRVYAQEQQYNRAAHHLAIRIIIKHARIARMRPAYYKLRANCKDHTLHVVVGEVEVLHKQLLHETTCRRELHNQLWQQKNNVTSAALVDTSNLVGATAFEFAGILAPQPTANEVLLVDAATSNKISYSFDKVHSSSASADVRDQVCGMVKSALDGISCVLFHCACSTTSMPSPLKLPRPAGGSAVAHPNTIRSSKDSSLLVFHEVFEQLANTSTSIERSTISISYCGVSPSGVIDLLSPRTGVLQPTNSYQLAMVCVNNINEANIVAGAAASNLIGAVSMLPSMLHTVMTIHIVTTQTLTGQSTEAKIHVVELCSSSGHQPSCPPSPGLNASFTTDDDGLAALGCLQRVYTALGAGMDVIPYEASVLTTLLRGSMQWNSKAVFLLTADSVVDGNGMEPLQRALQFCQHCINAMRKPNLQLATISRSPIPPRTDEAKREPTTPSSPCDTWFNLVAS